MESTVACSGSSISLADDFHLVIDEPLKIVDMIANTNQVCPRVTAMAHFEREEREGATNSRQRSCSR